MQILLNFSSIFPTCMQSILLLQHLQCSRKLHEEKIKVKLLSHFFLTSTQLSLSFDLMGEMQDANEFLSLECFTGNLRTLLQLVIEASRIILLLLLFSSTVR